MLAIWIVAACGRFGFGPGDDAVLHMDALDPDAVLDAEVDATFAPASCWPAWQSGAPNVGTVRRLDELAINVNQGDPFITADGLTLYFVRAMTGLGFEVFAATRPDRVSPF